MAFTVRLEDLIYVITPPSLLCRQGKLPDYRRTYRQLIAADYRQRKTDPDLFARSARRFCYLCRLLGLSWVFWLVNFLVFCAGVLLYLFMFGYDLHWDQQAIHAITFRQVFWAFGTLLFVGWLFYFAVNYLSGVFDENCRGNEGGRPNTASSTGVIVAPRGLGRHEA